MFTRILLLTLFASFSVAAQQSSQMLAVDVMYPQTEQKNQVISLSGTVEAKQHAQLAPLEAGRVSALMVEVGDIVSTGQPLMLLDETLAALQKNVAQAEVTAAKVSVKEAKRLYQEVVALSKKQLVAQTLIAERGAFLATAEAQLARAEANYNVTTEVLNRHKLLAPFTGVIAQRNVDIGEWVSQQTSVLTLVAQNDLRLSIAIPQQYYSYLAQHRDINVEITPDVVNTSPISASLSRLVPVSDTASRSFVAQIDLPENIPLVSGMSAIAQITVPRSEQQQIILPRSAIKQHPDGGSSVFYVDNGIAKRVITDYKALADGRVAITNQSRNRAYIISGIELLKDNTPVTIASTAGEKP